MTTGNLASLSVYSCALSTKKDALINSLPLHPLAGLGKIFAEASYLSNKPAPWGRNEGQITRSIASRSMSACPAKSNVTPLVNIKPARLETSWSRVAPTVGARPSSSYKASQRGAGASCAQASDRGEKSQRGYCQSDGRKELAPAPRRIFADLEIDSVIGAIKKSTRWLLLSADGRVERKAAALSFLQ